MAGNKRGTANALARLKYEIEEQKNTEEWISVMSYKIFLLEKELGYQITSNTNGLILIQRLRMFDRYNIEQQKAYEDSKSKDANKKSDLMK